MAFLLRTRHICQKASVLTRLYTSESSAPTTGEAKLKKILEQKFPQSSFINVDDISGGCGSMYEVQIEAAEFKGKRTVMQHKMVTEALKEEIKEMHGLRISTAVTQES